MKGISPVIATVLLLLMAIGAVGGAWVWYQRMQSSAQVGGEAGVEAVKKGAYTALVYVDSVYISGSDLKVDIGNQADEDATLTKVEYRASSSSTYSTCTSTETTVPAGSVITVTCSGAGSSFSSGDTIYIKLTFKGGITREFGTVVR